MLGASSYASFSVDFRALLSMSPAEAQAWAAELFSRPSFYLNGLWYSVTILAILGCHEIGHYLACAPLRRRRVAALSSCRPRSRSPARSARSSASVAHSRARRALFDIGVAGPIAGFVVAVPALFIGLWLSRIVALPTDPSG